MKPIDFANAAGLAALVIDVLIAIGVVFAWGVLVEPGHPSAYYQTAGIPVARWSTRIAGTALVSGAAWLFAKRRPRRNAWLFAVSLTAFYAFLDGASAGFADFFTLSIALTMLLKLLGALTGAFVAIQSRTATKGSLP